MTDQKSCSSESENGTSADGQLDTYRRTGDLKFMVDRLVDETKEGWS